jgi:PhzF family phenazine biosynthesis protein
MRIKQFQVDAFASNVFEGNPAAVCPLDRWLDDGTLQAIAEENNLSETAFFVPSERGFHLRWFTPIAEVDLCGHATLASAHVLFEHLSYAKPAITFETRSGNLSVERKGKLLAMNFPAISASPCAAPEALIAGLGQRPTEVLAADRYIAVFDSEATIRSISPNFEKLRELDLRSVCITAPGLQVDFVSRYFAPKVGVAEDPVTGSAHCVLAPYWSARLGKDSLSARQVSKRGGNIQCRIRGNRVILSGGAVTFMVAEINIGN